jgi:drug/metabolite transporter (DMT)-like permease
MITWQLFLVISMIADTAGRLLQRTYVKQEQSDPIVYATLFQLFCGIIMVIIAAFVGIHLPPLGPITFNLLLVPILYGLATLFIYKSLKNVEASVFTILFASRAIWIILGGVVVLREIFLPLQILGTVLILGSVVLVSWSRSVKFQKGEYFALLAAVLFALGTLNDTFILKVMDPTTYLVYSFLAPGLFIWLINFKKSRLILKTMTTRASKNIWIISIVYSVSALGFYWAYTVGHNIAQIASIYQISTITTIIFAVLLLRERDHLLRKLLAMAIGFIGVLLVSK